MDKGQMKQTVKNDWVINNQNTFGLKRDIDLSLSAIQYEILNQLKSIKVNSISDYLGAEIDISKEIRLTQHLTIEKVFSEFLGFENFNPLKLSTWKCSLILNYLQLSLLKEYGNESNKNILTFSEYENQYSTLLDGFLSSNIDTDKGDFIKTELSLCDSLITELNKPVYSVINLLNEVLNEPCIFKKNLINSIDKRTKFLVFINGEIAKTEKKLSPPEKKTEQETIETKPVLKPEAVQAVFEIIKDFFITEQQDELKQILETGNDASQHLVFLDNGNRLADAFKQLKKADVITGCKQKELESWIQGNFKYKHRKQVKEFTLRYLNDIISTNKDNCQRPILNVTVTKSNGKINITKA
ncbi:MAG: hypothetical protein JKX84_02990 [Flavobacteriales bacterium]|nr:hypothetical protein [Flavobacteriales bacterium]